MCLVSLVGCLDISQLESYKKEIEEHPPDDRNCHMMVVASRWQSFQCSSRASSGASSFSLLCLSCSDWYLKTHGVDANSPAPQWDR